MARHTTGYLFKRGPNFYCRWTFNGKVFSKALRDDTGGAITTRRQAEEAQAKLMAHFGVADEATALESIAGKLEGRKADLARLESEQNPPLLIANAWPEYLSAANRPDSGESTLRQYEFQFAAFARWMATNHAEAPAMRDVTKAIAEQYAGQLNHGKLSASTHNKHVNLLELVFRVLKGKARLTENPWEDIQRKRINAQSRRELTVEELRKVCQSATGELRTLLGLGVYTGLRLGDCATLRWAEVDLARNIIRRIPNKTARRNSKPVIVPIYPDLLKMLATTPAEERREYVLPETAATYQRRTDMVTDMVQRHFQAQGINPHKPGTGTTGKRAVVEVGFHSLRHTFVSLCRASDVPLSVVESLVGHASPAMTRHYTHTGELAAGRAVASLPSIMTEAKTLPAPAAKAPDAHAIRAIAETITAENWQEKKAALLALVA